MAYLICYIGQNHKKVWTETGTIPEFKKQHPGVEPMYIFNTDHDILTKTWMSQQLFDQYAPEYGFHPSDYKATVLTAEGEQCQLVGFHPRNRKYKCMLLRTNGKYYKATVDFVVNGMMRYQNYAANHNM